MDGSTGSTPTSNVRSQRAERHPLRIPLRYRLQGQQDWSSGETINLSESGVLFSSGQMLDVDSRVEITFQAEGNPLLRSSTRLAHVVRRTLISWPETQPVFGAKFC